MKLILIGLLGLLPIWRDPLWKGGKSAYEAIYIHATEPQEEHISVEQAIQECRHAYQNSFLATDNSILSTNI